MQNEQVFEIMKNKCIVFNVLYHLIMKAGYSESDVYDVNRAVKLSIQTTYESVSKLIRIIRYFTLCNYWT